MPVICLSRGHWGHLPVPEGLSPPGMGCLSPALLCLTELPVPRRQLPVPESDVSCLSLSPIGPCVRGSFARFICLSPLICLSLWGNSSLSVNLPEGCTELPVPLSHCCTQLPVPDDYSKGSPNSSLPVPYQHINTSLPVPYQMSPIKARPG